MKTRDRTVKITDLDAVAHVEEDLVIFIDSEEENNPSSLCVQVNLNTMQFGPVQPLAFYLKSNSYQPIHDFDTQLSYRQFIQEEMNPAAINDMLNDFTQKLLYNPEYRNLYSSYHGWQPGG